MLKRISRYPAPKNVKILESHEKITRQGNKPQYMAHNEWVIQPAESKS